MEESPLMNKQRLFLRKHRHLYFARFFCLRAVPALTFPIPQNRTAVPDRLQRTICRNRHEAFAQYLNELFAETVTTDTVTLHSYMEHPQDFGIDNYAVTLGRYDLDALDNTSDITGKLTALKSFDRKTLSQKQQITYDELLIYLQNELEYSDLYLFHTDLCTTTGSMSSFR